MRQRGQAQIYILLAVGIAFAVLLGLVHYYRSELKVTEAQFESFKDKTAALGEAAKAAKVLKETQDAKQIADAVVARDDALAKLRQSAGAGSRRLSSAPAAPAGSNQICFGAAAYTAAFAEFGKSLGRFMAETNGLAIEGDAAQIDAKSLIQAWPKPKTP